MFRCFNFKFVSLVFACPEDFENSFATAFGPNDVTGHKKRRETGGHKTPDSEHLPSQVIGFA
jgi:hypothetical protein